MQQRHSSEFIVDFMIIGQMRAGTTLLHHSLKAHPSIFMPELKEPRYFNHLLDDPKRTSLIPPGLPVTFEDYKSLFEGAGSAQVIGEASPQYINSHVAAKQIKAVFPDVKIIASLRDPATRLYSMWIQSLPEIDKSSFLDYFNAHKSDWFFQSNFTFENLQRFYDQFDPNRIKVVRFEDLTRRRDIVLDDLFEFLGVENSTQGLQEEIRNQGGVPDSVVLEKVFRKFAGRGKLGTLIRKYVPSNIFGLAKSARAANMQTPTKLTAEEKSQVNAFFREDTLRLQELLAMELPTWLDSD